MSNAYCSYWDPPCPTLSLPFTKDNHHLVDPCPGELPDSLCFPVTTAGVVTLTVCQGFPSPQGPVTNGGARISPATVKSQETESGV